MQKKTPNKNENPFNKSLPALVAGKLHQESPVCTLQIKLRRVSFLEVNFLGFFIILSEDFPNTPRRGLFLQHVSCSQSTSGEVLREFLARWDKDGDDVVSPEEFLEYYEDLSVPHPSVFACVERLCVFTKLCVEGSWDPQIVQWVLLWWTDISTLGEKCSSICSCCMREQEFAEEMPKLCPWDERCLI